MKKIFTLIILISTLFLVSCSEKNEKLVYIGVDAEILSINNSDNELTVGPVKDSQNTIESETIINCENLEKNNKIFKSKNTTNIEIIKFDELKVGDKIKINISRDELNKKNNNVINVEQIELIEER